MLANSVNLKERPGQNMLEDLLDDSGEGRSNDVYADRRPVVYQRVVTTLTGSQNRQKSIDKQRRLEQLQSDYIDLRKKLNTVDRKNERILSKLKHQPAERQRSPSPIQRKVVYQSAVPDNPENARSLKQQVEMLQLLLHDKDMQLKERRLAQQQKEEFYRELLHNQQQEIACLELSVEATVPMQRLAQAIQNHDFATSMFKDEAEHKLRRLNERLMRAVSLMKRCGKLLKEKRTRSSRKRQAASSEISMFRDKQIDMIIGEYESTQRKLITERKQLQQELEAKRQEIDQERDKFDQLGQELKEKYAQLLAAAEQRHAESLDRYCREVIALKTEAVQPGKTSVEANAQVTRLTKRIQELERKQETKELNCQQQSQYNDQLKLQIESLRESLTRVRFEKENLTFELEKMRLNQNTTLELQSPSDDNMEIVAQLTTLKEQNDSIRQQNLSLQRENFELQLKHRKLEELKRELEEIYKNRLLEETQQNAKYREERGKHELELSQLKLQLKESHSQQIDCRDEIARTIKDLVQEYSDPFISLVWQQYEQELQQATIEILKGLRLIKAREKEEAKRIQDIIHTSNLIEVREHSTTADVVQRLVRMIQESNAHRERDKLAWRTLEDTLSGKITKLQAQVKKLKQIQPSKPSVATPPVDLQAKFTDMRKETEKKELLSRIEILEFDLQAKQDELEEIKVGKATAVAERDRMMNELRRQLEDKSLVMQQQSESIIRLEQQRTVQPTVFKSEEYSTDNNDELERLLGQLAVAEQRLRTAEDRIAELEFSKQRLQDNYEELKRLSQTQADEIAAKASRLTMLEHYHRDSTISRTSGDSDKQRFEQEIELLKRRVSQAAQEKESSEARAKQLEKHNLELVEVRQKEFIERERLAKIRKSNEELIEKRLNNKLEQTERLKSDLRLKHEQEQQLKETIAKLQKEVLQLQLAVQDKEATSFAQTEQIARLTNEREGLEAAHTEFRETYMEKVKKHKGRCAEANATVDKLKASVQSLTEFNYKLEDDIAAARDRIKTLQKEKSSSIAPDDIAKTLQQLSDYESRLKDTQDELKRLLREKNVQEQEYLKILNEHTIMKAGVTELQDELADASQRIATYKSEIVRLNEKIEDHCRDIDERHKLDEEIEQEILRLNARNEQLEGYVAYYQRMQSEQAELTEQQPMQPNNPIEEQPARPVQEEPPKQQPKSEPQEVEEDIFGIAEEPYIPNRPSTESDPADFVELFLRIKSAIERILDEGEISVEFYSQLPMELEKPFEELIEAIRQKMKTAVVSDVMVFLEDHAPDASLEGVVDEFPEGVLDEVLQQHSNQQLVRRLKESREQIEELKWASENHQRTVKYGVMQIEQIEQQQQEKEEEQEARHITQLTLLKRQLKEFKHQVDSLEMQAESTKRCFFKILETCFSEQKTLIEDLSEAFNHLTNTAHLSQKEHGQLIIWFQEYRKNAAIALANNPPQPEREGFLGWFRTK